MGTIALWRRRQFLRQPAPVCTRRWGAQSKITRLGFEPRLAGPKPAVLPLHHRVEVLFPEGLLENRISGSWVRTPVPSNRYRGESSTLDFDRGHPNSADLAAPRTRQVGRTMMENLTRNDRKSKADRSLPPPPI